jgi:hypothetical protein
MDTSSYQIGNFLKFPLLCLNILYLNIIIVMALDCSYVFMGISPQGRQSKQLQIAKKEKSHTACFLSPTAIFTPSGFVGD